MNFLILFLLISSISISKIRGDKHCAEQKCSSELSEWCCPCRNPCVSDSGKYNWCCDNDQTCASFPECAGGSSPSTAGLYAGVAVVIVILILICGCMFCCEYLKKTNTIPRMFQPSDNQGGQRPVNPLMNNSNTQANSNGQVYNIRTRSPTAFNREEPPPTYEAAMASSTKQNQNKI